MKKKLSAASWIVATNVALVQIASAHPGPPGHTHGDDWPFGVLAVIACATLAGLYGLSLKIRDARHESRVPVKVRSKRR